MSKEKRNQILGVIITLLVIFGITALFMYNAKVGIIVVVILFAILLIGAFAPFKSKKAEKEYKLKKEEALKKYGQDSELKIDEYNITANKSSFIQFVKIISNNKITNYDFIENNMSLDELALKLEDGDEFYMLYFDWKECLDTIVYYTNQLLNRLNYNVTITEEQVKIKDNEFIKNRRKDNMITTDNDLNVINEILKTKGYMYITFPIDADGYWLAIISMDKVNQIQGL